MVTGANRLFPTLPVLYYCAHSFLSSLARFHWGGITQPPTVRAPAQDSKQNPDGATIAVQNCSKEFPVELSDLALLVVVVRHAKRFSSGPHCVPWTTPILEEILFGPRDDLERVEVVQVGLVEDAARRDASARPNLRPRI